ncbi:MAG: ABC transporter ATP-binding protein, partial [Hyphomicrobiales bacterium]
TNDLDMETLDLLQEVIADYDGTVLIVSHDRDFLDRTVTITLGLDGTGKVDIVAGGYEDWQRKRAAPREVGRSKATSAPMPSTVAAPQKKLTYKDQRDLDLLPVEIEKLEAAIARDEAALADPDLYRRDPARFDGLMTGIETARRRKEEAELRWLELAELAEARGG